MWKSSSEQSNAASGGSTCRSYMEDFRRDGVRLVTDEWYSIAATARACGATDHTVGNWLGRYSSSAKASPGGDTLEELRAEVTWLRKGLKRVELERAIHEKAAARHRRFDWLDGAFAKNSLCRMPGSTIQRSGFPVAYMGQKRATDITYLAALTGWVYLAVVIELFSRRVVDR